MDRHEDNEVEVNPAEIVARVNDHRNDCPHNCTDCKKIMERARWIVTEASDPILMDIELKCYAEHFSLVFRAGSRKNKITVQMVEGEIKVTETLHNEVAEVEVNPAEIDVRVNEHRNDCLHNCNDCKKVMEKARFIATKASDSTLMDIELKCNAEHFSWVFWAGSRKNKITVQIVEGEIKVTGNLDNEVEVNPAEIGARVNDHRSDCPHDCTDCKKVMERARLIVTEALDSILTDIELKCNAEHFSLVFRAGSRKNKIAVQMIEGKIKVTGHLKEEIECNPAVSHQHVDAYTNLCFAKCDECRHVMQKARVDVTRSSKSRRTNYELTCNTRHFNIVFWAGSRENKVVVQEDKEEILVEVTERSWNETFNHAVEYVRDGIERNVFTYFSKLRVLRWISNTGLGRRVIAWCGGGDAPSTT